MRHRHLHAFEPASANASAQARRRDHPRRLDAGGVVVAVVFTVVGVLLERQPHAHPRRAARVRLARARGDADAPIDVHEPRSTTHSSIERMNRIESNRIEPHSTTTEPRIERESPTNASDSTVRSTPRARARRPRARETDERANEGTARESHTQHGPSQTVVSPYVILTVCPSLRHIPRGRSLARAAAPPARDDDARGCRPRIRSARSSATARTSVPIARLRPPRTTRRRRLRDAIERRNARPPPAR